MVQVVDEVKRQLPDVKVEVTDQFNFEYAEVSVRLTDPSGAKLRTTLLRFLQRARAVASSTAHASWALEGGAGTHQGRPDVLELSLPQPYPRGRR
jgi:hypothetical protein